MIVATACCALLLGLLSSTAIRCADPPADLALAISERAPADDWEGEAQRIVLDVRHDGAVTHGAAFLLLDPEAGDRGPLRAWLSERASAAGPAHGGGPPGSSSAVLLRVDADAAFVHVQRLMADCARADVGLWRLQLAVDRPEAPLGDARPGEPRPGEPSPGEPSPGRIDVPLRTDADAQAGMEAVEVVVRVLQEGGKVSRATLLPWTGPEDGAWTHDGQRLLEYQIGPLKIGSRDQLRERLLALREAVSPGDLVVDARPGVTHAEVVRTIDAALAAGFDSIHFTVPLD